MTLQEKKLFFIALNSYVETLVSGVPPLTLTRAKAKNIKNLTAFGGTYQGNLPQGYTQLANITNADNGYLDTGIVADIDDMEFDIVAKINDNTSMSWYVLQSRASGGAPIYGISGSQSNNTFIGSFSGTNVSAGSTIVRQSGHTYHVNSKCQNGALTLTVEDLTDNTTTTVTGTYTFTAAITNIGLFSNMGGGTVASGNTSVISAYIKKGGVKVLDYVPALNPSNVVGFYDKVTDSFKVSTAGTFVADQPGVPTPTAPMDIVCNNGVLKVSPNMTNVNANTVSVGYYISASGTVLESVNNFYCTPYIAVKPNTTYTLSFSSPLYFASISEYSSATDAGFIVRNTKTSTSLDAPFDLTEFTITTGATTNYIRWGSNMYKNQALTIDDVLALNYMLAESATTVDYIPYGQIYTDGTVETIQVTGKNKFNKNNLTRIYAYISASGAPWVYVGSGYSVRIPCMPNTTYTARYNGSSSQTVLSFASTSSDDIPASGSPVSVSNSIRQNSPTINTPITITTGASDKWLIVAYTVAEPENTDMANNLQIEMGSTATDYQSYHSDTATCEDLLSVGDHTDEQEVVGGNITRKVGVLVCDGTENWQFSTALLNYMYSLPVSDLYAEASSVSSNRESPYCTHFNRSSSWLSGGAARANMVQAYQPTSGDAIIGLGYGSPSAANLATFKAWLATQYANGTPVIIIYPLKADTTETVTAQPMQTTTGDNTAEITQASMAGLEISTKYYKQA